jgi:hypothetical protein
MSHEVAVKRIRRAGYTGLAYAALQLLALPFLLSHTSTGWTINWDTLFEVGITVGLSVATLSLYFIPTCLLGFDGLWRVGGCLWALVQVAMAPGGEPLANRWRWFLSTVLVLPFAVMWIRGALAAQSFAGRKDKIVDQVT